MKHYQQRVVEVNPLSTQGSNFIAVQDSSAIDHLSLPHQSPATNIGKGKNYEQAQGDTSNKSHGRTS